MKQDKIPLTLRLDENIHLKLRYAAEKDFRSLNAQIEYYIMRGLSEFEKEHGEITFINPFESDK